MDAARGAMGQGWPFTAGLWSDDDVREPAAQRRAVCKGQAFLVTFVATDKSNPPVRGGTQAT